MFIVLHDAVVPLLPAPRSHRGVRAPAPYTYANAAAGGALCVPRRVRRRVTRVLLPAIPAPRRADSAHAILDTVLAKGDRRGHRSTALSCPCTRVLSAAGCDARRTPSRRAASRCACQSNRPAARPGRQPADALNGLGTTAAAAG
jgi:hypothetical protein